MTERSLLIRVGPNFVKEKLVLDLDQARKGDFRLQSQDRLMISSAYQLAGGDKQIILSGHVKLPGPYTLARALTLFDVLYTYAGLGDPDYRALTYLERGDILRLDKETGRRTLIPFNVEAALNLEQDLALESSDEIRLYPVARFRDEVKVSIEGEVRIPGAYDLTLGMNLGDLISQAGGMTGQADRLEVEVVRVDQGMVPPSKSAKVRLAEVDAFELKNDDIVFIRRLPYWHRHELVTLQGEVKYPGRYALVEYNQNLSQLVADAGGLSKEAFLEGARLTRSSDEGQRRVAMDMAKALDGDESDDIILERGDVISIPTSNYTIDIKGAVQIPGLVQYLPGKKARYRRS